jgi:copper(I)-binding protein
MIFRQALLCALLVLADPAAGAHDHVLKGIAIDHPYAAPTVPGASTGAVYLGLRNGTKAADRLVSASTPRAKRVELHSMARVNDVMRMREVDAIELKPGARLDMKPGAAFHLMMVELAAPLKPGEKFPLTLEFAASGRIEVSVTVETPKPAAKAQHQH